jgi:predicted  nucleic acid-binding Zn-ribbon protein
MSADVQFLINLIVGLCGGFGAWVLRAVSAEQKELAAANKELAARLDSLPNLYARRDDVREAMHRIEAGLQRIEDRLDQKADK